LGQQGVTDVIIFEGVNDIGGWKPNHAEVVRNLQKAYTELIQKAKAAGKKVYIGTIAPYYGNGYYNHFSEAARLTINDWIRANKEVDGIIDFDELLRDPAKPNALLPKYSSDGLHGTPAAYEAMGKFAAEKVK